MKVQEYLEQHGVPFQSHEHPPAYTSQEVAAEEHVSGKMLAKGVLVRVDDNYALCVLPANLKLDMDKVSRATGAKQAFLADESDLAKLFPDSEVGAEPPFGNLYNLPTLVDKRLAEDPEIVFQAGSHRLAIRMKYSDYEKLVCPEIADLAISFD